MERAVEAVRRALFVVLALLLVAASAAPVEALREPTLRLLTAHAASPAADTVRFTLATNRACDELHSSIELLLQFRVNGQPRTARETVIGCPSALVVERMLFLTSDSAPALVHLEVAQLTHSTDAGRFPFSELRPDGQHDSFPDVATLVPATADIWPRLHYGVFLVSFAVLIGLHAHLTDPLRQVRRVRASSSRQSLGQ
ncbi:MAG: hypothetical protein AABX89_08180 [Candidatus Thermoplasmatota archaeon]